METATLVVWPTVDVSLFCMWDMKIDDLVKFYTLIVIICK